MNFPFHLGHRNPNVMSSVKTVPWLQCRTTFLDYNRNLRLPAFKDGISEGQYCAIAIDPNAGQSRCKSDRGGSITMLLNDSDTVHIIGIVSIDLSRISTQPTVYTRVAYYTDWIASHVWPDALGSIEN